MHASAESLARLAPKIVSLESQASGFGDLKPLDLAGALAGLPAGPYSVARCAWTDDRAAWNELIREAEIRLRVNGVVRVKEVWQGVIAIAASEYCWPPRCAGCEGRMIVYTPQPAQCRLCNGSGYGKLRASQLCDAVGVSLEEWKAVWRHRHDRAYSLIAGWGSEVLCHLSLRLSD